MFLNVVFDIKKVFNFKPKIVINKCRLVDNIKNEYEKGWQGMGGGILYKWRLIINYNRFPLSSANFLTS
jgi:hypothetical protein